MIVNYCGAAFNTDDILVVRKHQANRYTQVDDIEKLVPVKILGFKLWEVKEYIEQPDKVDTDYIILVMFQNEKELSLFFNGDVSVRDSAFQQIVEAWEKGGICGNTTK